MGKISKRKKDSSLLQSLLIEFESIVVQSTAGGDVMASLQNCISLLSKLTIEFQEFKANSKLLVLKDKELLRLHPLQLDSNLLSTLIGYLERTFGILPENTISDRLETVVQVLLETLATNDGLYSRVHELESLLIERDEFVKMQLERISMIKTQ